MRPEPLTPFDGYALLLPGGQVLLSSPQAVLDVLRALQLSAQVGRRDGVGVPARVTDLTTTCALALDLRTSAETSAALPQPRTLRPLLSWVGAAEAAEILGLSERQVRNRAEELGGRRAGRCWRFDPAELEQFATARQGRRRAS